MNDEAYLLTCQWRNGARIAHIAHSRAAAKSADRNRWLGVSAVLLATLSGGSGLSTLGSTDAWVSWVAGLAGAGAALLAGAQTYLNDEARAEQHRRFAAAYGDLRRRLELLLIEDPEDPGTALEEIRVVWDDLNREAPPTPDRVHEKAKAAVPPATPRGASS